MLLLGHAPFFLIYNLTNGNIRKCRTDIAAGQSLIYRFSPDGSILAQVKSGEVRLLDWASGAQLLLSVQQPTGEVRDLQWLDQNIFATFSSSAEVFVWNASTRECISRWRDESGFGAQAMNACPDFVAIRSVAFSSVYFSCMSHSCIAVRTPVLSMSMTATQHLPPATRSSKSASLSKHCLTSPLPRISCGSTPPLSCWRWLLQTSKTLSNWCVSPCSPSNRVELTCVRQVHTGGMTVFPNWPTAATPLGRVTDVAFSNNSEYMAISNHKGKVLLYRIEHFAAKFKSK